MGFWCSPHLYQEMVWYSVKAPWTGTLSQTWDNTCSARAVLDRSSHPCLSTPCLWHAVFLKAHSSSGNPREQSLHLESVRTACYWAELLAVGAGRDDDILNGGKMGSSLLLATKQDTKWPDPVSRAGLNIWQLRFVLCSCQERLTVCLLSGLVILSEFIDWISWSW